jgi:hypothetical protein
MKRKTTTPICGFSPAGAAPRFYRIRRGLPVIRETFNESRDHAWWRDACDVRNGIMTRRCLLFLALTTALVLVPLYGASAESLADQPPRYCQIRTTDYRLSAAVEQGLRDSATFRALVDQINVSDVVVYVSADEQQLPRGIDGRLTFLSASGGFRYVVVHINSRLSVPRLVSLIAHELQHAREIADTTTIVDAQSMAREYAAGLGYVNRFVTGEGRAFDSRAAVRAGEEVLREVLARQ